MSLEFDECSKQGILENTKIVNYRQREEDMERGLGLGEEKRDRITSNVTKTA